MSSTPNSDGYVNLIDVQGYLEAAIKVAMASEST